MTRYFKTITTLLISGAAIIVLPSCATISESECVAGNWADLGYRDGLNGVERQRIADYANTCSEYGAQIDRKAYLTSYEAGLGLYCTYDKGYARGYDGSSYNDVCAGALAVDYRPGYDDGYAQYRLETDHQTLIKALKDIEDEIDDVRRRLRDPETPEDDYDRLRKKRDRLEDERQDIRQNLRDFERANGLDLTGGY